MPILCFRGEVYQPIVTPGRGQAQPVPYYEKCRSHQGGGKPSPYPTTKNAGHFVVGYGLGLPPPWLVFTSATQNPAYARVPSPAHHRGSPVRRPVCALRGSYPPPLPC